MDAREADDLKHRTGELQTDLFPASMSPASTTARPPPPRRTSTPPTKSRPLAEPLLNPVANARTAGRQEGLQILLESCAPVRAGTRAAAWLKDHRIFKKTWDAQGLRVVEDYRRVTEALLNRHPASQWFAWGFFNKEGHLRFYRHTVLVPWFDGSHPVYLQACAPDLSGEDHGPPELFVSGPVPCPYNARLLDGVEGRLYLCGGAVDTLELLEAGFPAVGVPMGTDLRPAWLPRFRNKSVFLAFDADAAGEAAAAKAIAQLSGEGVEAHRLRVPAGKRVGDWLAGK
jgi:DNA primase